MYESTPQIGSVVELTSATEDLVLQRAQVQGTNADFAANQIHQNSTNGPWSKIGRAVAVPAYFRVCRNFSGVTLRDTEKVLEECAWGQTDLEPKGRFYVVDTQHVLRATVAGILPRKQREPLPPAQKKGSGGLLGFLGWR
jgi:hypothetical protein